MDITDISKVASRKRLNVESEKLREKVSRETAKIIKLKVAQDTAYWDLKEKLHQLENNHERLQQNMVEVQMQHETISGQYQDELRLRPETLNKMSSIRKICGVLEEYSGRLRDTMERCKTNQAALYEAYQKSGVFVVDMKQKQTQEDEKNRAALVALEEKLKLTTEHQSQLLALFNSSKQQADAHLLDTRTKLEAALTQREELLKANGDLARDLEQQRNALDMRDKTISSLQSDIKRYVIEFDRQCNDMKNTIQKNEKDLKESIDSNDALIRALTNQEAFTNTMREQNNALQEKVSALEEEGAKLLKESTETNEALKKALATLQERSSSLEQEGVKQCGEIAALHKQIDNLTVTKDSLTDENASQAEVISSLESKLLEKTTLLSNADKEIERLLEQVTALEAEKKSLISDQIQANEESNSKSDTIAELARTLKEAEAKVVEMEKALQEQRNASDEKIKDLKAAIEEKANENTSKVETITKLMNEIKLLMEQRSKLETNIERGKKEMEIERDRSKDKEKKFIKQVEQLEVIAKDKEQDLSKRMTLILELRTEKEKLHEKILGMQSTIDNIQKELTGRFPPREPQPMPEQDDNAVTLSPTLVKKSLPVAPRADQGQRMPEFAVPRRQEPSKHPDESLFHIFSDSSTDGPDSLDSVQVNRRFEAIARGEKLPQVPLSALKRRRPPILQPALKVRPQAENDSPISLSQMREDMKQKNKLFFKSKRVEKKLRK